MATYRVELLAHPCQGVAPDDLLAAVLSGRDVTDGRAHHYARAGVTLVRFTVSAFDDAAAVVAARSAVRDVRCPASVVVSTGRGRTRRTVRT